MIKHILLKNFGPIVQADLEINDLTIICGKNSVGKTYLSYSYYMLSKMVSSQLLRNYSFPTQFIEQIKKIDFSKNAKHEISFDIRDSNFRFDDIKNELSSSKTINHLCNELDVASNEGTSVTVDLDEDIFKGFEAFSYSLNFDSMADIKLTVDTDSWDVKFEVNVIEDKEGDSENLLEDLSIIFKVVFFGRFLNYRQYAVTSERTGISLFYSESDDSVRKSLTSLRSAFSEEEENKSRKRGVYSEPIEDNISTIRAIKSKKMDSYDFLNDKKDSVYSLMSELRGGQYVTQKEKIYFQPNNSDTLVPLHASSGASKSLLLLDHFVYEHQLDTYGTLVIDEPELNLHLDSQKKMAHVLSALVNNGIKVLITTHCDHFVREINNLIMLSNDSLDPDVKKSMMEKGNIIDASLLKPEQVSTIVIDSDTHETLPMQVSKYGIDLDIFNEQIIKSNDISSELFMEIYESE